MKQDSYVCQMKIHTLMNTGIGWTLRTLATLWRDFFMLWKARNKAIHGHDPASQQLACKRKLRIKIEFCHDQRDQVLTCNSNLFLANTTAALHTHLEVTSASLTQKWLNIWRPIILSTIELAKDLSLDGVCTLNTYFLGSTNTALHHPPNNQAHCKARPK
jgi:hypothetical protein